MLTLLISAALAASPLVLTGPTDVDSGTSQTWTVRAPDLPVGVPVTLGWSLGEAPGTGPCVHPRQTGGSPCLDIAAPAARIAQVMTIADPSNPGLGMAEFHITVFPTAPDFQVYLQAISLRGPGDSATSNVHPVLVNPTIPSNCIGRENCITVETVGGMTTFGASSPGTYADLLGADLSVTVGWDGGSYTCGSTAIWAASQANMTTVVAQATATTPLAQAYLDSLDFSDVRVDVNHSSTYADFRLIVAQELALVGYFDSSFPPDPSFSCSNTALSYLHTTDTNMVQSFLTGDTVRAPLMTGTIRR